MNSKAFFKRLIPFLGAFSLGIFIASFFVTIGGQSYRGHGRRGCDKRQTRIELQRLRQENLELQTQLNEMRLGVAHRDRDGIKTFSSEEILVEAPLAPPPPPAIPHNHR